MNIDTLCFSAGSIYGLSYITALQFLIKNNYFNLDKINTYVGTSIGSIISFLLIIGYHPDELYIFFKNFDIKEIEPDINIDLIFENYGFDNFNKIIDLLKILSERKIKLKQFTFYDLFILTKKKFIINATNFNKGEELIMDYEKTPNLCIFKAISMSCCIPLIYTPILYENNYYLDGSLSNNILINICNPETTLGFFILNNKDFKLTSIKDLILGSLVILNNKINYDKNKYKVVCIYCDSDKIVPIELNNSYILSLFKIGKTFAKKFYKKELLKKINLEKNNIIQDILNNIINQIENK
jgi:NTE family protein